MDEIDRGELPTEQICRETAEGPPAVEGNFKGGVGLGGQPQEEEEDVRGRRYPPVG